MPSCIKAPSSGKTVGAYWENFWTLGWKSTENYPSSFSVLMKIWPTDCLMISCNILKMTTKQDVGRKVC